VRTPAIAISPLIPRNTIDHRVYDHSSVPATLEAVFGLSPLTARDANARNLLSLLSLGAPRMDEQEAPTHLPTASAPRAALTASASSTMADIGKVSVSRPNDPIEGSMLPAFVHAALRQDLQVSPERKSELLAAVAGLRTRADAARYLGEVQARLRARERSAG
jgi:phospholipase C